MNQDILIGLLLIALGIACILFGLAIVWQARATELHTQALLLLTNANLN